MESSVGGPTESARKSLEAQEEILRAKREEENQGSGLLRIPPECRNKIVFCDLEGSLLRGQLAIADAGPSAKNHFRRKVRSLAQVCRTLRTETTRIFWGSNHFRFDLQTRKFFCECLKFVKFASNDILASLRKFDIVSRYWETDWTLPAITFLIDRERQQVRVLYGQVDTGKNFHWCADYLDLLMEWIETVGPHKNTKPLTTKQLSQLLILMSPRKFLQTASEKNVLR